MVFEYFLLLHSKLNILETCRTKQRSTNVLTSGGPKATKERRLGLEIVHVCFRVVGDSVLGAFYVEFFRATLLDE